MNSSNEKCCLKAAPAGGNNFVMLQIVDFMIIVSFYSTLELNPNGCGYIRTHQEPFVLSSGFPSITFDCAHCWLYSSGWWVVQFLRFLHQLVLHLDRSALLMALFNLQIVTVAFCSICLLTLSISNISSISSLPSPVNNSYTMRHELSAWVEKLSNELC